MGGPGGPYDGNGFSWCNEMKNQMMDEQIHGYFDDQFNCDQPVYDFCPDEPFVVYNEPFEVPVIEDWYHEYGDF